MRLVAGLIVALLLGAAGTPFKRAALSERKSWPDYEEYVALPPPKAAPLLAAGYRELAADITWVRALVYYGSGRIGESEFVYLTKFIDNVIALDPHFKRVYEWAAYSVTHKAGYATKQELELSAHYLELAIERFPDDGRLFWDAGIRYWLYMYGDTPEQRRRYRERAAELIEAAMHKPNANPNWPTMAAELRTRLGQKEQAIRYLREMILTTENKKARQRMLNKFGYLVDSVEVADELAREAAEFERRWKDNLPYAPPSLFVLLGPEPSPVIDFDRLATERDLFMIDPSAPAPELVAPPEPEHLPQRLEDDRGAVDGRDAGGPR